MKFIYLAKYGLLFKYMHFVANDTQKFNNAIKACLTVLNIILYYAFSLNICQNSQYH